MSESAERPLQPFYTSRNANIYERRMEGATYRELADEWGISIGRVRQIVMAEAFRSREQSDPHP
jgi:Mor family transcriptional regulator